MLACLFDKSSVMVDECTYKKAVFTPHLVPPASIVPLIIKGVQKLNMMAMRLDDARDQPAVFARRGCRGTSAA